MQKNALVQIVLIFIALNSIYYAAGYFLQYLLLYLLTSANSYRHDESLYSAVGYFVIVCFGMIIISYNRSISTAIANKAGMDGNLTVFTTPKQLLSIVIVAIALSSLLSYLPGFISKILGLFRSRSIDDDLESSLLAGKTGWATSILHVVLPCLMIIFARSLTNYFAANVIMDDEEIVAHSETIEIEGPGNNNPA